MAFHKKLPRIRSGFLMACEEGRISDKIAGYQFKATRAI